MLLLVLMAAWFAFAAARKKRKWYIWAAIGLAISAALNMLVFLPFDLIVGDREIDSEIEMFVVLILLILNIVAAILVTSRIKPPDTALADDPADAADADGEAKAAESESADKTGGEEPSGTE